jgi:2-amino-4-hydroxy-6-hydroxymethyldihydropteridine diphosphokinase
VEDITAYLGLGSNLGDREENIRRACQELGAHPKISVERLSSLYETAPVGVTDQPDFLNAAVAVRTSLPPEELLAVLLATEAGLGRTRNARWGPRVIDIDLLVYGDETIDRPNLTVPHPRLHERAFALIPLAEIAPHLKPPGFHATVAELAPTAADYGDVRRAGSMALFDRRTT